MGPRGQRIVGLLFGILLVAMAEGALRLVGYTYTREEVGFRFVGEELTTGSLLLVQDRRLFWRLRSDAPVIEDGSEGARVNAAGFRGALIPVERRPGVPRVACLGDSVTYGSAIPFAQTYAGRLARRLEEQNGQPAEVLNAGCPGYSSFQGLELLKAEIVPRRPDVVTFLFGAWNDYTPAIGGSDAEKARQGSAPDWIVAVRRKAGRFRLFMAVERMHDWMRGHRRDPEFGRRSREAYVEGFRKGAPPEGRRVSPEEFRANLVAMVRLCRANHIQPILISPPLSLGAQKDFPVYHTYRGIVAAVAMEENVPLLPAADALTRLEANGQAVFRDWVHPNADGHAVIADLLAPVVSGMLSGRGGVDAGGTPAEAG
jgi:lysophospholipase L1-like esterase